MSDDTISTRVILSADMLDRLCRQVQENPSDFVTLRLPDGSEAALVDKKYLARLIEVVARLEASATGSASGENYYLEVSPQTVDELFSVLDTAIETVKKSTLDLLNSQRENTTDPQVDAGT